jgi:hypothetical protein
MNKAHLRRALLVAGVIETALMSASLWFIHIGGMHSGGLAFIFLHFPSSFIFGPLVQILGDPGNVFSMLLTAIVQFLLFTFAGYKLQRFFQRAKQRSLEK